MKLTIDNEDELTHAPEPYEVWRESYWIDVIDDETGIGVLMYFGVQPGRHVGYGFINICGPNRQLYRFRDYQIPVAHHHGGHTELAVGPFSVIKSEPLTSQSFRFDNGECAVDIDFESTASVYDYPWPWTRSRHWEQIGRSNALVRLPGSGTQSLCGTSVRDHAWGLRQLLTWHGFTWITGRSREDGPSWTICWLRTAERTQILGHLVEPSGDTFLATDMVADLAYEDGLPSEVKLTMNFDGYEEQLEAELKLYGVIDMSSADPEKQGNYYFSLAEGVTNGKKTNGTFDVFSQAGIPRLSRLPF